ncbi:putative lysine-specific demethylase JMJ16 isoform X1 [Syzygium oleosum]|uniref:putative lysine-specific demethylase JMJ16 isoform X1 n=1 Tax=Syzygium oleosum TaxID=219896 RepID=UPI0011D2654C|nr:putative lysine-specific demethylase JMJ16 isoform X1 [Syzygium oleosum]XP_030460646.1 putative lysine-specific demethylase JMJ16 isoform X1 [Syzygium oleosum]
MMGTLMRICVKEENDEFPLVPPGFEAFSSFTLRRVQDNKKEDCKQDGESLNSCAASASASELQSVKLKTEVDSDDVKKVTRPLRRRSWSKYNLHGNSSDDELDCEKSFSTRTSLPKGVIRGCPKCRNCQKVCAKWRPEDARRPNLDDAPVFYPTEEEFEDTLKYIAAIRPRAEHYGICRIVPPPSWKPPCPLKEKSIWEESKFATRVQRVDKLQNRDSMRKISLVQSQMRKKRRKCMKNGVDFGNGNGVNLCPGDSSSYQGEGFGFEHGPEFTLDTFKNYAEEFKTQYFTSNRNMNALENSQPTFQGHFEPSLDDIEGEYWRMVEKPTEEIEVLYGADLETGAFGSGFPKASSQPNSVSEEQYVKSGWNLNNFPRLPGSVLSYESGDISGVLVPWLYIGMCFSSFCWHVEDHHLYSLNYMHWGAPKMWYGVPGTHAVKLEEAMRKHLPDLFEEQPDLLHKLVTQLSPSILKPEGVPVYRCIQNPGEFVLTFPRAYHSGFNCGFNCAEAVNVAPVDWLPHGQIAVELYREQGRKTSVSHDKLLLGAAREAVRAHWELNLLKRNTCDNLRWKDACGRDGILAKAFKTRVEMEQVRREPISKISRAVKMENTFDATTERECTECFFDLHLSAAGCRCSPDRYTCLNHARQLCSCAWGSRFFLFRYDINELNILVEALEGKLSAIYRWARLDLGLALSSYVSKEHLQAPGVNGNLSSSSKGTVAKDGNAQISITYMKDLLVKNLSQRSVKTSPTSHNALDVQKVHPGHQFGKEESSNSSPATNHHNCQLSEENGSCNVKIAADESGSKKSSVLGQDNIILLSDDEGEEPEKSVSLISKEGSSARTADSLERQVHSDTKASACAVQKEVSSTTSMTGAPSSSQGGRNSSPEGQQHACASAVVGVGLNGKDGNQKPSSQSVLCVGSSSLESRHTEDSLFTKEVGDDNSKNSRAAATEGCLQHSPLCSSEKHSTDEKQEKGGSIVTCNVVDYTADSAGSSSFTQSNLDKYFRQKGPRIAKVVRRINCNVEPLDYGVVLPGKSWSGSQTIFPKGFRSRVKYINVLEPANMCFYVSEILDGGGVGPLFMVSLEHCTSEVFVHVSPTKCWEMVRERLNSEIAKQHKMGKMNLPPLQPPGSLDGFEMFGFSSPAIVQAIEALDQNRICIDYWASRPYSRPQVQVPHYSSSMDTGENVNRTNKEASSPDATGNHVKPVEVETALKGLFGKADLQELRSLYTIINQNKSILNQDLLTTLLSDEILKRPS